MVSSASEKLRQMTDRPRRLCTRTGLCKFIRGTGLDVDFLTPALLPPRTPMFRDVNTTGFTQITQPGK